MGAISSQGWPAQASARIWAMSSSLSSSFKIKIANFAEGAFMERVLKCSESAQRGLWDAAPTMQ
ncbi:hypothetical protein BB934_09650 [Microvirga ossetica]|uniref:Uncharacterized protein n=1 Tax=Microvirga ossetica TaxID=1882682 RepID=A0A1B2EF32_9HYPH|nr:hypothetical protein BB934_09650 [Microvirga ossetica]